MRILFWNTNKNKDINSILSEMIVENNISIAVLAEYDSDLDDLLVQLKTNRKTMYPYFSAGCDRIRIIGSVDNVEPAIQTHYASMQIINGRDILCCLHLNSQIFSDHEGTRNIIINQIMSDIRATEKRCNIENTIVVGDFNINPYDAGCTNAMFFHSMPVYTETKKRFRTVAGQKLDMFYNPMWNFLGDYNRPCGTYYYGGSGSNNVYWHIYDQVMIRPALRDRFVDNALKILTQTMTTKLVNDHGYPNHKISDHLPIVFEILEDHYEEA